MPRPSKAEMEYRERARQEEIQAAAQKMMNEMIPSLVTAVVAQLHVSSQGQPVTTSQPVDIASLATAMVRASNPKNRTQALDPELMTRRKAHYNRMVELIEQAKANDEVPIYKLRGKTQLNTQIIDPQWREEGTKRIVDTEINWDRIPNEAMIPVNDVAKKIHAEYKGWIGLAIAREGQPKAPWLTGAAPWIHSGEGVIRGKAPAVPPELGDAGDAMFPDPRRTGRPNKAGGTRILGSLHPPLIETPGT